MKTETNIIEIQKQKAITAYGEADEKGKKILENLFGKELFSQKITDRIKNFDDVLTLAGKTLSEVVPYANPKDENQKALNGIAKCWLLTEVLNEGWKPNYSDTTERKWYIWWEWKSSGFGFSDANYVSAGSSADVGSRLCFKTQELAIFAGRTFPEIFNEQLTINK